MTLKVVSTHADIVCAINGFDPGYHSDYRVVRNLSSVYLASPTAANAGSLAKELVAVLVRWGAGKRGAPGVQPLSSVQATLMDPNVLALLNYFVATPITALGIAGGSRTVGGASLVSTLATFDRNLNDLLLVLSSGVLSGNTNVTYPLKALLLLTGFMPALDSQVRKGLAKAGFSGVSATRFLMPTTTHAVEAKKLSRLPFYLADCYAADSALLTGAAAASKYPWLASEPGRLFDVLLFMQGSTPSRTLHFTPPAAKWFALA